MDFEDFFKTRNGQSMKETFYAFVPATALTIIFSTMSEWVESEFERKTKKDGPE